MIQALRKLLHVGRPSASQMPFSSDQAMEASAFFNAVAARPDAVAVFDALYQALTVGHQTETGKGASVAVALAPYALYPTPSLVAAFQTDRVASHFSGLKGGKHRVKVEAVGAKAVFVALSKNHKRSIYHILRRSSDWLLPKVDALAKEEIATTSGRLPEALRLVLRTSVRKEYRA